MYNKDIQYNAENTLESKDHPDVQVKYVICFTGQNLGAELYEQQRLCLYTRQYRIYPWKELS